jgi:hypothetical protein
MGAVTSHTKTEALKLCLFLFHHVTCSNFQGKFKTPKKYYTSKRKIIRIMVGTKMSVPFRKIYRSLLSVLTCIVDNTEKFLTKIHNICTTRHTMLMCEILTSVHITELINSTTFHLTSKI